MKPIAAHFFIRFQDGQMAYRSMSDVPRVGDKCVFDEKRYVVAAVEWCMDLDASSIGNQRVNIELEPLP